jgi:Ser/Thr protein kinase RdoA (MazF antagonist)
MKSTEQNPVPAPDVVKAYYPEGIDDHTQIGGGEINTTFKITASGSGEKTILQLLNKIYDPRVCTDFEVLAEYLRSRGWEMPVLHKTTNGKNCTEDARGNLWRAYEFMESTPGSDFEGNLAAYEHLGGLLGSLHQTLRDFNYIPQYESTLATPVEERINQLNEVLPSVASSHRKMGSEIIMLTRRNQMPTEPAQIIHGDTRIGNTLFRAEQPFTFIDWDDFRMESLFVDIGDMLQSTVGEVLTKGSGRCSLLDFYPMLKNYYTASGIEMDEEVFIQKALTTAQIIALDLGMRHLIDFVEVKTFQPPQGESPKAFNLRCANRQWEVYSVLAS